jgi:hypothetical protein
MLEILFASSSCWGFALVIFGRSSGGNSVGKSFLSDPYCGSIVLILSDGVSIS